MNRDTLIQIVRDGTAAETKVCIEKFGSDAFHFNTGEFAAYGIRYIEEGIAQSTVEKDEKQRLVKAFSEPGASGQELRDLRETVAAQGEQIERLSDLLTAFVEASLPAQKKAQKTDETPKKTRTIRNAL